MPYPPTHRILSLALLLLNAGCANVTCPEGTVDVNGDCEPTPLCDREGATRSCGTDEGECVAGTQTCTDGEWGTCEDATGPETETCDGLDNDCDGTPDNGPDEVCDGLDNDCDSRIDEGVLEVKEKPVEDGVGSLVSLGDYFLRGRWYPTGSRIETYTTDGEPTGEFAIVDGDNSTFGSMSTFDNAAYALYSTIDEETFNSGEFGLQSIRLELSGQRPVITHTSGENLGFPRSAAGWFSPRPRLSRDGNNLLVVGGPDIGDLAVRDFSPVSLIRFSSSPWDVSELTGFANEFDTQSEAEVLVWRNDDNQIRIAQLAGNGNLNNNREVASGFNAAVGLHEAGDLLGVVLRNTSGELRLFELNRDTFICATGRLCDFKVGDSKGNLAITHHHDTWFIVNGREMLAVARDGTVIFDHEHETQTQPDDVQIVYNGATTAVVQSNTFVDFILVLPDDSAVTFIGCFDE